MMADNMIGSAKAESTKKVKAAVSPMMGLSFEKFDFAAFDDSLEAMLKAGVHFGHLKSRLHPRMSDFVFLTRQNINIIDLEKTKMYLDRASDFLVSVVKSGKPVIFVGMKKHTHLLVQSLAERLGEPYVIDRWLGGTLTNYSVIKGRTSYLRDTEEKLEKGEFQMYTKFERQRKMEEVERLEKRMGGIKNMRELPGAIVIADGKEAKIVIREAHATGVPVVAIIDTNADPSSVEYPIPGNDDALSSLRYLLGSIGRSISSVKAAKAAAPSVVAPKQQK
jgi:small subunit ribosomal protein S2